MQRTTFFELNVYYYCKLVFFVIVHRLSKNLWKHAQRKFVIAKLLIRKLGSSSVQILVTTRLGILIRTTLKRFFLANVSLEVTIESFYRDVHDDVMSEETAPEIQRTNLAKVVLYLKALGVHDVIR